MGGPLRGLRAVVDRARRVEHRELRELRRWIERTDTLVHLSALVFLPLLIAVVTALSNVLESLSFLLFPPLASGTYTLFADPEGRYSSPVQFVAGMNAGALCGWASLEAALLLGLGAPAGGLTVAAFEAAAAVFAAAVVTWALDIEEPSAYATALLGLLVRPSQEVPFVASVFVASTIVAVVFYVWRERFYDRRAEFLYEATRGDDRVLVPMDGENPDATAMLAARLAAAHEAGKVVLLDLVDDADAAAAERDMLDTHHRAGRAVSDGGSPGVDGSGPSAGRAEPGGRPPGDRDPDGPAAVGDRDGDTDPVAAAASHLEMRAAEIETRVGVPCEVVVAVAGRSRTDAVQRTAREVDCDLVAAPYEERHGALSPHLRSLFRGETDVLVHRSRAGRTRWKRVLVMVRRASDVAHGMVDFAARLAGKSGHVSTATCVSGERERRRAEEMLADLVEPFEGTFETRVSTRSVERFLAENAGDADLVVVGASQDRSAASRLLSPPTFERIRDVDADVAIVDRN